MAIEDLRKRTWILLPGTLCTSAVFDGFLDALEVTADRRHTVPMCHATVEAYHDELARTADGAVICGFSLGAIVAAHLADRLPATRTILFGLNPYPDDPEKAEGRRDLLHDVMAKGGAAALSSRLLPLRGQTPEIARLIILSMADTAAPFIDAQTHLALNRPGALKALSKSRSPVLVLTGDDDQNAPVDQGAAAAQIAPHSRFCALPGLSHYALLEDPAACAKAVRELEDTMP